MDCSSRRRSGIVESVERQGKVHPHDCHGPIAALPFPKLTQKRRTSPTVKLQSGDQEPGMGLVNEGRPFLRLHNTEQKGELLGSL